MAWAPTLLSGLELWLDAATAGSVDGTPVATWSDLSGCGHHVTQAAGARQPLWKANQQGGLPAVVFDGSNDFMASAAYAFPTATATLFAIAFTPSTVGGSVVVFGPDSEAVSGFGLTLNGGGAGKLNASSVGNVGLSSFYSTTVPKLAWHLMGGIFDRTLASGETTTNVDGVLTGSQISNLDNTDSTYGTKSWSVGAGSGGARVGNVSIGEVVAYNRVLSTIERQTVEGYLMWRWGLQALLPAGHPYQFFPPGSSGTDGPEDRLAANRRQDQLARLRDDEECLEAVFRTFATLCH